MNCVRVNWFYPFYKRLIISYRNIELYYGITKNEQSVVLHGIFPIDTIDACILFKILYFANEYRITMKGDLMIYLWIDQIYRVITSFFTRLVREYSVSRNKKKNISSKYKIRNDWLWILIQINIFINAIKQMEFERKLVLSTEYSNEYSIFYIYFCILRGFSYL